MEEALANVFTNMNDDSRISATFGVLSETVHPRVISKLVGALPTCEQVIGERNRRGTHVFRQHGWDLRFGYVAADKWEDVKIRIIRFVENRQLLLKDLSDTFGCSTYLEISVESTGYHVGFDLSPDMMEMLANSKVKLVLGFAGYSVSAPGIFGDQWLARIDGDQTS